MLVTKKDYTIDFMGYGLITVPAGTPITHQTANGYDTNYNFVNGYAWIKSNYPEIANILHHDVIYHGINVPKEFL